MKDKTVLVLCHTVFHNAFRSDKFREQKPGVEALKNFLRAKFISDFIIEVGSESPEGDYFGVTSKKIFDEFSTQLEREDKFKGLATYLTILKNVIFCVPDEKINEMEDTEGIIVIADTLSNRGSYEPIIITDMKEGKMKAALAYYQKYTGKEDPKMPFSILNPEEAIGFLQGRYPDQCELVKQRDKLYKPILF